MLEPGFLTLFSSFIGAALFFCAGVFWNERPAPSRQAKPQPRRRTHAPELFGVDAAALSNSGSDLRAAAPVTPVTPVTPVRSPSATPPKSLDGLLAQLQTRLQASSICLLDGQGLLFSEGEDEHGAGIRLLTMLSVQEQLPQDEQDFQEPRAFVLGQMRLQKVPSQRGPEAWLALVGAKRFAAAPELSMVDEVLAREL